MPTVTGIATEFITFTRSSNATVTDSDGKVKWAPHNLLTNSESFDAAAWGKTNSVLTANSSAAPNGTTTADTLARSTDNVNNAILRLIYVHLASTQYTFSCFVKAGSAGAKLSLRDLAIDDASSTSTVHFDPATGSVSLTYGSTYTGKATMQSVGGGWYLCTISGTTLASIGNNIIDIGVVDGGSAFGGVSGSFVYVWGAHLYRSDLGGMQPNTSAYPMYNPTTPKNLLGYTEDFSNAAWNSYNTTETVNQITLTGTSGCVYQGKPFISNTTYTLSCKIKKGTNNFAFLSLGGGATVYASAVFDLQNGITGETKAAGTGYSVTTSTISASDDYYLCRMTAVIGTNIPSAVQVVGFAAAATGNTWDSYGNPTGCTSGNTLFVKQMQLSDSASLDSYVPVYGAAVTSAAYYGPRRDFDSATLACKGLLVEELRSNIVLHSNDFSQAAWTKINGGAGTLPVVTSGQADPWGSTTAWRLQANAGGSTGADFSLVRQIIASVTSPRSIWIKSNTGSNQSVIFGGSLGTRVVTATNTWTRVNDTPSSANTVIDIGSQPSSGNTTQSVDVLIWGAQCETASGASVSFSTSYIPTGSASATRNADVASVSTQAFPYSATAGSLVVAFSPAISTPTGIAGDGTASSLFLYAFSNKLRTTNGTTILASGNDIAALAVNKGGVVYDSAGRALCLNSGTVATDASAFQTTVSAVNLGYTGATGGYVNGHIRQITYLPRRISNAELQTRTA